MQRRPHASEHKAVPATEADAAKPKVQRHRLSGHEWFTSSRQIFRKCLAH